MPETIQAPDDEMDLAELFGTLWEGKWKILGLAGATTLSMFGFQYLQGPPEFIASTEIRPIATIDASAYDASNELGFFEVTPEGLLDLYVEELELRRALRDAIRDLGLVSRDDYRTEGDFDEALTEFVVSVQITLPGLDETRATNRSQRFPVIEVEYYDEAKWRAVLEHVDTEVTASVQESLRELFDEKMNGAQEARAFLLQDLDLKIENLVLDYERMTADRLTFLREQAEIARELGVASNTLEVQTFSAQNSTVAAVNIDTPFYLRGFEAIEKEITLIEGRVDGRAFVIGLLDAERERRDIAQDPTLDRAVRLWSDTPAGSGDGFLAASMRTDTTTIEETESRVLALALATALGGFIGSLFVLIGSAIRKRRSGTLAP